MNQRTKRFLFSSIALMVLISCTARAANALSVALKESSNGEAYKFTKSGSKEPLAYKRLQTPLGSLWKLFVYAYIVENDLSVSPYVCKGSHPDEVFCCKPGHSVDLDLALAKSCGRFFDFQRLGISQNAWKTYWNSFGVNHPWLTTIELLSPNTQINVSELLSVFEEISKHPLLMTKLRSALSQVVTVGTAQKSIGLIGSSMTFKTYTWDAPSRKDKFVGGLAGWFANGTSFWVQGSGKSDEVLKHWDHQLGMISSEHFQYHETDPNCTRVLFFDRYPIKNVVNIATDISANDGPLFGRYKVYFANGNNLEFASNGEIHYQSGSKKITGEFGTNNYVARVIDREIKSEPDEAAKAFAVLIRSYLHQNAKLKNGCYEIKDASRYQRVSINPPSDGSKRIAYWTGDLILANVPVVMYHLDKDSSDRVSWSKAVRLSQEGFRFDQILKDTYPNGRIAVLNWRDSVPCRQNYQAQKWLLAQKPKWKRQLAILPGVEMPESIEVCDVDQGNPYADTRRDRVFLKWGKSIQDKITLTHEYLHLVLKNHPSGQDETFVDQLAKRLVFEMEE